MNDAMSTVMAAVQAAGRKAFVPYVTGGLAGVDGDLLRALRDAGADAVEVGLPFSDPVMDGPVIQEASRLALEGGATFYRILALVESAALDIPVVVMTYVNSIVAHGLDRFAADAANAGVGGVIVPDLPVDEADPWLASAAAHGMASILLAAPNSTSDRLAAIAAASRGFVYCVASLGVTGARGELAGSARNLVLTLRPLTEAPLYVGVGITTPAQATEACGFADGVIVGTVMVEPILAGDRSEAIRRAEAFRRALDGARTQ